MRFGGRGGAFSFPQVFHTHSQSVCFVFWPKGGTEGEGFRNGLFLDGGEYVRHGSRGGELLFTYFAIAIWVGFACPFSPGSRHKSELSASRSSSSSDGWMDGNAVSQTFISTPGREGGRKEGADITEGRLLRGEQRRGVISCDWGSSVKGRERRLLPDEVP